MSENHKKTDKIVIDATGKQFGRLASHVAHILGGKNSRDYRFEEAPTVKVTVQNISQVKISLKKLKSNKYYHYSGYPGGMKSKTMEELFNSQPEALFTKTVRKMLPANKQRKNILKNLSIKK